MNENIDNIFKIVYDIYPNLKELNINKDIPNINVYLATNKNILLSFASKTFIKYL